MKMDRKKMRIVGMEMKATVQVGKSGLTETIENEIDKQLEKKDLIKIKMLQSMGPSKYWKDDIISLAERIDAEIIEIKGGTVMLYRKGKKRKP
ncbi:MAG: YhbY family RNA-binding protein [Thermoplasmatota archaeon]